VYTVHPEKIKPLHEIALMVFDVCGIKPPLDGYTSYRALLDKAKWKRNEHTQPYLEAFQNF
jgi:hypothetical protein